MINHVIPELCANFSPLKRQPKFMHKKSIPLLWTICALSFAKGMNFNMAKLYFRYGAMNSAKTANLLMVAHNYKNQGKNVVIIKPDKDTRWDMTVEVKSRAIEDPQAAISISSTQNLHELIDAILVTQDIAAILVEEAQFLSKDQVRELAIIVDEKNIPVLCYGLRCSYIDGA